MTLQLYAVTPVDAAPPEGFDMLLGLRVGVVHAQREPEPASDREAVLAFARTIERISAAGPALPVRYGTTVADLQELRLLTAEHEEAWAARLEAVAGCCELIVHLDRSSPAEPALDHSGLNGRDYLRARAAVVTSRDAVLDEVHCLLRPRMREARPIGGKGTQRLAVLVHRDQADSARSDLERWGAARSELDLAVTGPWPPFSFCEALP